MKLGLLRMSLDFRLRELPWDHGNGTRLDALRNELLVGAGSISPMYLRSRANSTGTMAKCNQYLTVAKPAALTGTLQIRFVASLLGSVAEWCWHDFEPGGGGEHGVRGHEIRQKSLKFFLHKFLYDKLEN